MNRWMGVSLVLAGVVLGMLLGGGQARLAWADDAAPAASQRCEWSYVQDKNRPELGEDGKIAMGEEWKGMSAGGWRLVTGGVPIVMGGGFGGGTYVYFFERCR